MQGCVSNNCWFSATSLVIKCLPRDAVKRVVSTEIIGPMWVYITMNQTEKEWSNGKSGVRFGSVCKRWLSFLLVLFFALIRLSNGLPSSHKTTHFCNNSRSNWIPQGSLVTESLWVVKCSEGRRNYPPTLLLSQHFAWSEKYVLMVA